jgi:hypothetical protein
MPGYDWTHGMQRATTTAERLIVVLSAAYLQSGHGEAEWRAFYAKDPSGEHGLLLPVRVSDVEPPRLLRTQDLCGPRRAGCHQRPSDAAGCGKKSPWQADE